MTKRVKKLLIALTIGIVLITAGIISGVCVINSSLSKRPTYVSTAEELVAAINDGIDKPIVLNNDITVHGDLTANKLFDLEMNGHDLRVIGKFTIKTDSADEMYLCDGKTQIKKREKVQADQVEIDAVNATITWNANVQLKDGYTADDFVVSAADHSFIFNGLMLGKGGEAGKTAMTVKQGRIVVSEKDEDVKAPAEIVVPSDAKDVLIENKTSDDVNIKASTSVSVSGSVSVDVDEKAEDVKITAPSGDSKVTIKSGTVSSVDAAGSEVIVDKGATVTDKVTAGKVENNGTVGEIEAGEVVDNSVAIRKEDKKAELDAYARAKGKDNYTVNAWEAVKTAVTAGNAAIDAAADIAGVDAAFETAKANIDAVKTIATELGEYKATGKAALEKYATDKGEANYTADNWNAIRSAVTAGKSAIDAAADKGAVDKAYDEAVASIDAVKTVATELDEYKATGKAALETYANGKGEANYTADNWTAIQSAVTAGKSAIDAAANEAAVDAAYNAAVANIDAVKTIVQQLADKKAEVAQSLKAAYDGIDLTLYRETEKNAITAKYEELKAAVNAVTDIANLPGTFVTDFNAFVATQKTNAQLTAEELAAKKTEVIAALDAEYAKYKQADYREAQWKNITAAYDTAKNGINAVTDIANLPGNFVATFTTTASAQKTDAQLTAEELAAKKVEVIGKLDEAKARYAEADYREAQWKNITDAYDAAKNGINAVTDIANLPGTFVADFTTVADAQPTDADLIADELAAKKAEVIRTLDTEYAKYKESDYRAAEWTRITDAYNTAKNGINAVTVITALPGNFVATFTATASTQKTNAQLTAEELAAKKAEVIRTLDTEYAKYKETDYRAAEWTRITEAYNTAKNGINAVTVITELPGNFVATFTATASAQKTNAQLTAEELAAKKAEVITTLDTEYAKYDEADYREAEWTKITEAYNTAKNGINAVTVITALPGNFVATFTATASAQKTDFELYQSENKTAINEYADNKGEDNYSAAKWTAIREYADAACDAIDAATDKNTVDTAVADAKRSIDGVTLAVVKLDGKGHDSLADAIAAITTTEEHTIKLLADVIDTTATEYAFDGVTVTLDLNGYTMDGVANGASAKTHYVYAVNGAVLTVTDGSEARTGKITASYGANSPLSVLHASNAKIVLDGGIIEAHDANFGMIGVLVDGGEFVMNGGEVKSETFNNRRGYAISVTSGATATINGGFVNVVSDSLNMLVKGALTVTGGTFSKEVEQKYLPKGYACFKNENGAYVVKGGYTIGIGEINYDTLSEAIAAANTGDVIKIYDDNTENEGNIKYIIDKAITVSGVIVGGVKPVINGTFAIDINGVSDGTDVVTIENLEIVHNGVYVKDGWTQDTKGAVVLQDGGLTLKNNYIHLVNPAPANVSNSPSGLQLTRRGTSVSTGAITVSGNTFGAYPKYSDKTNTIATAIQVSRNYTLSGVLVYGGLEVDDEKIYTGNKYENTDGNAQYVLYGNFDFAADKRGYTYVVFGDVFAYNRDGGDLLAGGKMIIARSFTLTDKVYDVKAGTELVIESGATLNGNGLTLNVYGTLTVKGKIENTNIVYGDDASRTIYLNGSEVDDSTVFDENAEYVIDITNKDDTGAFAIAAAAKVKKMTINLKLYSGNLNITDAITVVSPIVVNGYGAVKNTAKKTPFNVTADTAFIVKSGSLELNKIELEHTGTSEGEKNFIVADANANVTVDLATVAFVATADNTRFFNVASGATFNLNFVDDGSTFKVNTSTMVATADVFTVTKVEDGAGYVGADYYGNNFAAHNRDAYSTVNVTDKNGNALFNIENAIVTKGDETPTYYVATGAGLKTAITSGADYVKLMDDVVGSGESDTDVTVTAKTGDLETVIDLNGKQFGYELNLSTIVLNDAKKYEDTGYTLKVTIKNGKIGTESGYNQDAAKGQLYYGVLCQGNGVDLTLENVESSAYYGGLYANGAWKDNVITATDCKFASTIAGYGAYLPGKNTYNFTNCTFSGSVGVYIKSGDTTFTDCTINGNGEYEKPTYNGNGANGGGAGIVVDSTTGYQTPMTVTVNGGSITSANGYAIEEVSNAKANADKICYSTVSVDKTAVLTGKLGKVSSENGTVRVEGENGETTAYASTGAGVVNAMANGGTVVLTDDVTGTGKDTDVTIAAVDGNVETTLDLNGKTLGYELNLSTLTDGKDNGNTLKVTIKNGKIGTESGYSNEDADGKKGTLFYGLLLEGNGLDLTLEKVESSAYYGGLYMNGTWKNYKVVANDCVFNCVAGNAAYFAGYTVAEFNNCTFTGSMGAYAKCGDITFNDCTLTGKLPYEKPTYNGNGANGEGNGFTADSCVGYQQPLTVRFNGGSVTSEYGYAIEEISTAKEGVEKVCYSTVTVSKETVLTGKLGNVQSENGTVTIVA